MAREELQLNVRSEVRDALKGLGDVEKALKDVGKSEDDTKSKGAQMADALRAAADQIETDFAGARAASDALGAALGEEMVADIKAAGGSVETMVADFKKAGLTYDDVKADANELADAIKRLGDVGRTAGADVDSGARTAGDGLDRVSSKGDASKNALANMVGNSVQDLGALGGVAGSAGVAIGQLAEGAADGGTNLKSMVVAAAGMAAIAGVTMGISHHLKNIAETKAFKKGEVDGFTEALKEANTEVEAIRTKLEDAGKIEFAVPDLDIRLPIIDTLNELGVSVGQFSVLVAGGEPKIKAWSDAMIAAGANAGSVKLAAETARQQVEFLGTAQDNAAAAAKFFGTGIEGAGTKVDKYGDSVDDAVDSTKALDDRFKELTGTLSNREAWLGVEDALDTYKEKVDAGGLTARQFEQAQIDLKQELLRYIDTVGSIPASKQTEILALIDQGKLDEAANSIAVLTQPRNVRITPILTSNGTIGNISVGGTKVAIGATGGIVTQPTLAVIGEAGPEAVVPLNQTPGSSPLPRGGIGGGDTFNFIVNNPGSAVDTVRATREALREASRRARFGSRLIA